jgi:hypothetical protein
MTKDEMLLGSGKKCFRQHRLKIKEGLKHYVGENFR